MAKSSNDKTTGNNPRRDQRRGRTRSQISFENLADRDAGAAFGVREMGPYPRLVEAFQTPDGIWVGVLQARETRDANGFWGNPDGSRRFDVLVTGTGYLGNDDRETRKVAVLAAEGLTGTHRRGLRPLMHRANTVERRKATGKDYAGDPWMVNEVPRGMGCWHQLVWKQNMRGTVTLKGMRDMFVAEYGCDDSTRLGGFKTKPRGKVKEVVDEVAQRQAEAARKEAEATASAEERRRLEEEARQARAQAMVSPDGYIERRGLPNHEDRLNGSIFVVKRARMAVRVVENGALEETCAVPETANLMVVLRPSGDCHDVRVVCGNKVNFGLLMLATRHIAQWTQEGRSFTARGVRAAPKDLLTALAGIA